MRGSDVTARRRKGDVEKAVLAHLARLKVSPADDGVAAVVLKLARRLDAYPLDAPLDRNEAAYAARVQLGLAQLGAHSTAAAGGDGTSAARQEVEKTQALYVVDGDAS